MTISLTRLQLLKTHRKFCIVRFDLGHRLSLKCKSIEAYYACTLLWYFLTIPFAHPPKLKIIIIIIINEIVLQ